MLKYSEQNNNEKGHVWTYKRSVFRGQFISLNAQIKKQGRLKINELSIQYKKLEKEQQNKSKKCGRKEIKKDKSGN